MDRQRRRPSRCSPTVGRRQGRRASSEPELLLYRSNLLGADKRITNYGGGNTSAKIMENDPLTGETVEVLWVKGSGGDVGTMKLDGFATLYMDKLRALKSLYRGVEHEDEMVGYLPHCTFNLNPRAASIDTPLHAYRAATAMSTTCIPTRSSPSPPRRTRKELTQEIFGDEIGWLPWKRPGLRARPLARRNSAAENPGRQGRRARKPRPVHLGRRRQGLLRDDARHHQPGDRLVRRARPPASRPSAAQCVTAARRRRAPRRSPRG